jgi:hypothetical protein
MVVAGVRNDCSVLSVFGESSSSTSGHGSGIVDRIFLCAVFSMVVSANHILARDLVFPRYDGHHLVSARETVASQNRY